jgi:hypothetical protein
VVYYSDVIKKMVDIMDKNKCNCWGCIEDRKESANFMVLCTECGNKRCPKANDHENKCTNSNEVGQKGSAYK